MVQGPAWEARHGLTPEEFQHELDKLAGQGYHIVDVSGYDFGGQERYAAIWQQRSGPPWEVRHGLTADQYQQEFNRLTDQRPSGMLRSDLCDRDKNWIEE